MRRVIVGLLGAALFCCGFGAGAEYQQSRVSLTLTDGGILKNAVVTGFTVTLAGSNITVDNLTSTDVSGDAVRAIVSNCPAADNTGVDDATAAIQRCF